MTKIFRIFTDLHMFVLRSYNLLYLTVMYPGHLGDQCIGLGTQNTFQVTFFQLWFNKNMLNNDLGFLDRSDYFEIA